ncbi:DUF2461 domain-containing protein [Microbacterium sp.]|uniref:DUF2461 domain-containing protein n=1 Tax=Microbacterium sp. TaxID=51671 RepID=UPI003F7184EF
MEFTGLDADAPAFFAELAADNTKEWWTANKERYERSVRAPFEALATALEPEFGPVKIFRPYRDVRFSADKTPYKAHIGMVSTAPVAHYLQLGRDALMLGGGIYDVPPRVIARFREIVVDPRLAGDLEATLEELGDAGFDVMRDDALKTAPRGYPVDHPRIDLLRLRHLAVGRREQPAHWMWRPDALDVIARHWRAVSTWCDWITENLGEELAESLGNRRGR